jgi:ArsR family transcriptional regulator, arsenate/arsenite/antimonite-responsive transcriptional repressor
MPAIMRPRTEAFELPLADRTLHQLVQVFKLLADDSRLRILLLLAREGEIHVSALCEMLDESQPAVSHHLTLLRMANLVGYRRDGKFNYYYLDGLSLGDTLERLFAEAGRGQSVDCGEFALTFSRHNRRR